MQRGRKVCAAFARRVSTRAVHMVTIRCRPLLHCSHHLRNCCRHRRRHARRRAQMRTSQANSCPAAVAACFAPRLDRAVTPHTPHIPRSRCAEPAALLVHRRHRLSPARVSMSMRTAPAHSCRAAAAANCVSSLVQATTRQRPFIRRFRCAAHLAVKQHQALRHRRPRPSLTTRR